MVKTNRNPGGFWSCTCADTLGHAGQGCKHILALRYTRIKEIVAGHTEALEFLVLDWLGDQLFEQATTAATQERWRTVEYLMARYSTIQFLLGQLHELAEEAKKESA